MKIIIKYVLKYKKYLLLNLIGASGFVLIQIGIPTLLKYIINDALFNTDKNKLIFFIFGMLIFAVIGCIGGICLAFSNTRIATNVIRDIRTDLFAKTQSFSHIEIEKYGVSALITSTTSDAYQIMVFLQMLLRTGFVTPLMLASGLYMIILASPSLSVSLLLAAPILFLGVMLIAKFSKPISIKQQKTLDQINLIIRENLSGFRVIRAFRNEDFQSERFSDVNETYSKVSKTIFRLTSFAMPGFNLIFSTMIVITLWFGSKQIALSKLDIGTLNVFIEYIFHVLFTFIMLAMLFILYPRASVSANRIKDILNTESSINFNLNGVTETIEKGTIVFENVSFSYNGDVEEAVLKNININIKSGETVAFIGSTGSGKSTLVQLIPRFYDVTEGKILIDGVNIKDFNLKALREKIGFVPQKATLFTGTIEENLKYGKEDASIDEMKRAANIAQALDFINDKENGFNELLSEGGINLSGGQKQRLAIARAIVKNPEIYVFDDSFSALDYATDLKLRTELNKSVKDATILIVAQRVGTIMNADKIFVINDGEIVSEGTHEELLKSSAIYYDIASSQLSKEELEKEELK